jgi:putative addiction module component (TIGR02574 family)
VAETYPWGLVSLALQTAIAALTVEERLELIEYIESTVDSAADDLPEAQKRVIRARHAHLQADSSIGLGWDEIDSRIGTRWA